MRRDQLEGFVRDHLGDHVWGAALVDAESSLIVRNRLPEQGDAEIGSLSKGVTGLLYAEAVDRGEVRAEDRLDQHLPLEGCPAGAVTLGALAQHRSGLPRMPAMDDLWSRSWRLWRHQANPYGDDLDALLRQTRATRLRRRRRPEYSNLGFQLLGHALAHAAGTTYAGLVRSRVADPLGLTSWYVPSTPRELRDTAVHGTTRRGRPAAPWTGEGLGPAGGIRSSIDDLATVLRALVERRAPGMGALTPTAPLAGPAVRIGAGWLTTRVEDRPLTWHNGATGGWRSFLGIDVERGRGCALVLGTARSVDATAVALLREASATR